MGECFEETISECKEFINTNDRLEFQAAKVKLTEKLSLNIKEIEAFECEILKLDWESYDDK